MDAVMDLSARAASMIIVIQQLSAEYPDEFKAEKHVFNLVESADAINKVISSHAAKNAKFRERAEQLLRISNQETPTVQIANCLTERLKRLLTWIAAPENNTLIKNEQGAIDMLPSPEQWRNKLNRHLYQNPHERLTLATAIYYMPIQIILVSKGEKYDILMQRILQEWQTPDDDLIKILSAKDYKNLKKEKEFNRITAREHLLNDIELLDKLSTQHVPFSFEMVLKKELAEITSCRQEREKELSFAAKGKNVTNHVDNNTTDTYPNNGDPMQQAESMRLHAFAFSGGGIRSATFNLGILQGFAKAGLISKFDYLSTVSGGGYIGSWFSAWIKREGSVIKVTNRLNSEKSSDPMAEEVRPIRWLRMYSNYLSPNSSSMSADAWTVGMTILRNMLLNQFLILIMFVTLLLSGRFLFLFWKNTISLLPETVVFASSVLLIILAACLSAVGMRFYIKGKIPPAHKIDSLTKKIATSFLLFGCAAIFAFLVSAWFFSHPFVYDSNTQFWLLASLAAVVGFSLVMVAVLGRYDRCMEDTGSQKILGWVVILISSVLAAAAGGFLLTLAWKVVTALQTVTLKNHETGFPDVGDAMSFTFGVPLILEVLSVTIVIRMALLGNLFPDERRVWWGRMGGIVHRFSFLWILIAGSTLLGNILTTNIFHEYAPTAAGGWGALVLATVKAAYSSKSTEGKSGKSSMITNMLANLGPYLFGLGLLIFLPVLINNTLDNYFKDDQNNEFKILIFTLILAMVTLILSWRIGVNEFSLHHFYKNRLIRAYLGASVNRQDRKNTSNPFTGFDSNDDVLLSDFKVANKYFGPYPIINTTLNASQVSELDRQDRKGESFIFSPLFCGFDFSRTRAAASVTQKSYEYGYRPTEDYAYPKGIHIGSAMAISGAAANPNQGNHSSAAVAFLLTVFNVRLGWWIGNPRKNAYKSSDPTLGLPYLIADLIGKSNTKDNYVCLSDGGHFDNMGLYELIRRRTAVIILGDGEQDDKLSCEGLANAIRRCRIDFGVEITIDVSAITQRTENISLQSYAIGEIRYPGSKPFYGTLIYLKSSLTKNQSTDVKEYSLKNPNFPHQTTGDQFFDETQFESYRKLGLSIAEAVLKDQQTQAILNYVPGSNLHGKVKKATGVVIHV